VRIRDCLVCLRLVLHKSRSTRDNIILGETESWDFVNCYCQGGYAGEYYNLLLLCRQVNFEPVLL